MNYWTQPVTLHGEHVILEPLHASHAPALAAAAADGELWKLWYTMVPGPGDESAYIDTALKLRDAGSAQPFAVRDRASGDIVGSTRYMNIDNANQRLELGSTWYAKRVQRTALNTEAKLLLLGHAFETLEAIAVEFRTHFMNHQSRTAITRLGAKQDGILRNHQRSQNGALRDTVVFSIIASEWAAVRAHLQHQLLR
ncbi:GNAT family protein [Paraburkholderia bonniea]|uniref:GNAT family N-acetyltransferase n=1 Tax=Paraburkholderia bonniea TaxID=2152891 RepID=UPI0012919C16|nr:GNAT family protein [Paraburkholderia bonniea]WJF91668.1 GNAT family protein [Paraburkholderia bonniea]WJF94987.1 GNAT family protein [Paraburkholderia bonniea]